MDAFDEHRNSVRGESVELTLSACGWHHRRRHALDADFAFSGGVVPRSMDAQTDKIA